MRKIILFFALCFVCALSFSADVQWKLIKKFDEVSIYYDPKQLVHAKGFTEMDVLVNLEKSTKTGAKSAFIIFQFECGKKTIRYVASDYYADKFLKGRGVGTEKGSYDFESIKETDALHVISYNFACKGAPYGRSRK